MFFDEVKIYVKAGDGGDGVVAFRREKFVPRGGPAGGNGGKGGDVVMEVDPQLNTLIHFKSRVHFKARRGGHGGGKKQAGAAGEDVVIKVPPGTVVRDAESGRVVADMTGPGHGVVVAAGGRGGRGNAAFATSTNQAPRIAENGAPGEERWLELELKLIADVGLVGMPNAGKSTLLASVSAARPKIAPYPFTTLQPNLGVVYVEGRDFVLADIPGLIEGASEGAGLGHKFLRHVERTRLLLHVVGGDGESPVEEFARINRELAMYSPRLAQKPQVAVFNKMDLPEAQERWPGFEAAVKAAKNEGMEVFAVSAATGEGVRGLMLRVAAILEELPPPEAVEEDEELPVIRPEDVDEGLFSVRREGGTWRVRGVKVERLVAQTKWDYEEAAMRTQRALQAMGVIDALRQAGVEEGDTVFIGDYELEWQEW